MAIGLKKYPRYLDPETCFRMWSETNSIHKVCENLFKQGVKNPRTGEMPSDQGVWNSAWLYVFDHLPEGRKVATEAWKQEGEILTDERWYTLIVNKARYLYTRGRFNRYMEAHPYLLPYSLIPYKKVYSRFIEPDSDLPPSK